MDEPLSNLDAKLRVQTRAEIARLHQRLKTTIVYVTHDQVEAMTMGTRIAVMSEGLLQQVGTPQELYDMPVNRFVAGFIGSPAMNFLDVTVTSGPDGPTLVANDVTIPVPPRFRQMVGDAAGRHYIAGIRPEHLDIGQATSDDASMTATADVVEYLGNEELLHLTAAGQDIVAIVDAENRVTPGDKLSMVIPLDKVQLFDPESGLQLGAQRTAVAAA